MASYVESYITLDEFKVMQSLGIPYTGFVRGVGYTYPEYFSLEFPMDWSAINNSYWSCKPMFVQAMDTSTEAIIRSLQISTNKLTSLLMHEQGGEYHFNMGNGQIIAIPANVQTNFSVNVDYSSLQLYVSLNAKLENGNEVSQITNCSLQDLPSIFNISPSALYPSKDEGKTCDVESIEEPNFWVSLIPVFGSGYSAYVNFKKGNYGWGTFYVVMAVSDIFLVKSIGQGIAKGAWKAGSHRWGATRKWLLKHGYAQKGEPVHHWLIHQETAEKYNLEWLANQPWNWKTFPDNATHIRFGHMKYYGGEKPGNMLQHILYGIPIWPKATTGSYGGRMIYEISNDED